MDIATEKQLVLAAKTDSDSFAKLYDYYFPKVYAFVASKIYDQDVAEDLVSDIFMKMLKALPNFEWRGLPFAAWVFRIARNRINDYIRDLHKTQHVDIDNIKESLHQKESESPVTKAKQSELHKKVTELMKNLPEREADVIKLKFFVELSNKEIAEALAITESNVGVIIFRTLKLLKPELENFI